MRKPMPLRWIEEAEERQVLATARERLPPPPFAPVDRRSRGGAMRRWIMPARVEGQSEPATAAGPAVEPHHDPLAVGIPD